MNEQSSDRIQQPRSKRAQQKAVSVFIGDSRVWPLTRNWDQCQVSLGKRVGGNSTGTFKATQSDRYMSVLAVYWLQTSKNMTLRNRDPYRHVWGDYESMEQ